jgi:hypothetical protein
MYGEVSTLLLLFNIVLGFLAKAMPREIKELQIRKEKFNSSLFSDMFLYLKDPKECTQRSLTSDMYFLQSRKIQNQPTKFNSFHISLLLMIISTGLKILYLFLCRKYINQIHILNFFLYPPSLICDFHWYDLFFIILLVFVVGLYSTYE